MRIAVLIILLFFLPLDALSASKNTKYLKLKDPKIIKKIKEQKNKIRKSKKKESSILKELDKLDKELNSINLEVKKQKAEIRKVQSRIRATRTKIEEVSIALEKRKTWFKRKIKSIQRNIDTSNQLMIILNTENFREMMRMNRYLSFLARYDFKKINEYKNNHIALIGEKTHLKGLLSQLDKENRKLKGAEKKIIRNRRGKEKLLASVKNKRKQYTAMLRELERASRELQKLIKKTERKTRYSGKGFRKLRGKLPWPVQGKVAITYGTHRDPRYNTPVFRNGIYIKTKKDANVNAIHYGKVVFADSFRGLGQVVIVNHGMGYHSVYANLSRILSNVGVNVGRKAIIGRTGNPSVLNSNGIYFELRYRGKPTNPLRWLKKK